MTSTSPELTAELRARVAGPVLLPGDDGYSQEVSGFNLAAVARPDIAVGVTSVDDMAAVIEACRKHGARVHVQATGHGDHDAIDGGVLVSTRRLDHVVLDAGARTANVGAGSRWAPVVAAAAEHGLASITGSSPDVGVVGYLLGGGAGPLAHSHGFSSDYLVSCRVVTGMGELVDVDVKHHPDLFWAIRGGKSGLGIVADVTVRLPELRMLYAGSLFFDEPDIEVALRSWTDWSATADADVTTSVAIIRFPPLEVVPAPMRGRRRFNIRFAYPGDLARGEALAAPIRALAPVYLDFLAPLPAAECGRIHNDPTDPSPAWVTGMVLDHIDQGFVTQLLDHFGAGTNAPFVVVEVRHLGSRTSIDVPEGSAVSGRTGEYTLSLVARVGDIEAISAAGGTLSSDIRPWISPDTNANFTLQPGIVGSTATPSATMLERAARLERVRRQYDPDGLFAGD